MKNDELIKSFIDLDSKLKGINGWISDNRKTDPNFYEICDCWISFGLLAHHSTYLQEENDFKTVSYFLTSCREQMAIMEYLRGISKDPFLTENKDARALYNCVVSDATRCLTDYDSITCELIKKSLSVPFYIWQEKSNNSEFKYDNKNEFDLMKTYLDVSSSDLDNNKKGYISNILEGIEKDAKWIQRCNNVKK